MDASTTTSEKDKRAKGMELLQSHAGKGKSWKKILTQISDCPN
jgi:hypothetical protein